MRQEIYEIVDSTCEETYYSQGVFSYLTDAVAICLDKGPATLCNHTEDIAEVSIRERPVGELDIGDYEVVRFTWEKDWEDTGDWVLTAVTTRPSYEKQLTYLRSYLPLVVDKSGSLQLKPLHKLKQ